MVFLYQLLMIFGLALFSMLLNLVQRNIEIMTDTITYKMRFASSSRYSPEQDRRVPGSGTRSG